MNPIEQIEYFNKSMGLHVSDFSDTKMVELMVELVTEEGEELREAFIDSNETAMVDAFGDLIVVAVGALYRLGYDPTAVLNEIYRSNMSKLGADGKPIYREDGKLLKGPNFSPPDLTQPDMWRTK